MTPPEPPNSARKVYLPLVGRLVKENRDSLGWSQQHLGTRVGRSKQWVAAVEAGRVLPPLDHLVPLFQALHPGDAPSAAPAADVELARWLVEWLDSNARARSGSDQERALLDAAIRRLRGRAALPPATSPWRSLDQFPAAFEPLTVVAADRRDQPPETRADACILSGAVGDLTFLPRLTGTALEVKLRSDKLVLLGTAEMRRRELGRSNLLVVSSPAANWAARVINGSALFHYDVPETARRLDARLRALTELDDGTLLRLLWRLLAGSGADPEDEPVGLSAAQRDRLPRARELARELLAFGNPEDILSQFSETGILDPVADRRFQLPGESFDYAMISLAPNPFAEGNGYVSILASGMHGRGTAHALGALVTDPQLFQHRPFGGVIQVNERVHADWSERFLAAEWSWRTPEYTPESLVERYETALAAGDDEERPPGMSGLTDADLRPRIDFIRTLARD